MAKQEKKKELQIENEIQAYILRQGKMNIKTLIAQDHLKQY